MNCLVPEKLFIDSKPIQRPTDLVVPSNSKNICNRVLYEGVGNWDPTKYSWLNLKKMDIKISKKCKNKES